MVGCFLTKILPPFPPSLLTLFFLFPFFFSFPLFTTRPALSAYNLKVQERTGLRVVHMGRTEAFACSHAIEHINKGSHLGRSRLENLLPQFRRYLAICWSPQGATVSLPAGSQTFQCRELEIIRGLGLYFFYFSSPPFFSGLFFFSFRKMDFRSYKEVHSILAIHLLPQSFAIPQPY